MFPQKAHLFLELFWLVEFGGQKICLKFEQVGKLNVLFSRWFLNIVPSFFDFTE